MIKGVLFDFRDTLLDVKGAYKKGGEYLYDLVKSRVRNLTFKKFERILKVSIAQIKKEVGNNPQIHNWTKLFVSRLYKNLSIDLTENDLTGILKKYDLIFSENVTLYEDAEYMLKLLKKIGIKTGAVIDGTSIRERKIIKKLKLAAILNPIIISEEVRQNKFTSKPLENAVKLIGLSPKQLIVIGDRIDKDIVHANKLGCMSVKLERIGGRYAHTKYQTEVEKPNLIIHNLNEILDIIQ